MVSAVGVFLGRDGEGPKMGEGRERREISDGQKRSLGTW